MPCIECGVPRTNLCEPCKKGRDRRRGTSRSRGYGADHERVRREWAPKVEAGEVDCWRCGTLIEPGSDWHLGHADQDRSVYEGPEHARCNLSAAGRIQKGLAPLQERILDR